MGEPLSAAQPATENNDLTSDQCLQLIHSMSDCAVCIIDNNGKVASWSHGAHLIKGYREDEIVGQHFGIFYTSEDIESGAPNLALKQAAEIGSYEGEGWRIRKDGSRFWAHASIVAIRDESRAVPRFVKLTRDLTERRTAEESLRRSQDQFRCLVQCVADYAIFTLDMDGLVTSWNLGAQRIKGFSAEEIIGRHVSCLYTAEDRQAGQPQRSLETALRTGRFETEGWRVRKDGTRFWANVVLDLVRDEDGIAIGFAKVTRDMTERKEARRVLDETRDALFQSQKLDALGQLAGGIAHDFNNLMSAVAGSLELALMRLPDTPAVTPLMQNALAGAQRAIKLTSRMLSFARRQKLDPEPVDLAGLVRDMEPLFRQSLRPGIFIEIRVAPGLGAALADRNQLELAVLNLVINARDAMPDGGTVVITADEQVVGPERPGLLQPGAYLRLAVADTGIGMDADMLTRAAEPFYTTKGVGLGTGLGLSMVHGMAEQLRGGLMLRSTKGEGTTAEVWLRRADATPIATSDAPTVDTPTTATARESLVVTTTNSCC